MSYSLQWRDFIILFKLKYIICYLIMYLITEWNWLNNPDIVLYPPDNSVMNPFIITSTNTSSRKRRAAPFSCGRCNRSYCQKQHLNRHQKYECGAERQFHCNICSKKFIHKSHLQTHMVCFHKTVIS